MSDLSEDELASIVTSLGGPELVATSKSETCRMVAELQRHRSALAADRERVRMVVRDEMLNLMVSDGPITTPEEVDAIATRAAEQLATARVRLSEEDRAEAASLIEYLDEQRVSAIDDGRSGDFEAFTCWQAALSRLLGASQ